MLRLLIIVIILTFSLSCRGPLEPFEQMESKTVDPIVICYEHAGRIDTLIIPAQ